MAEFRTPGIMQEVTTPSADSQLVLATAVGAKDELISLDNFAKHVREDVGQIYYADDYATIQDACDAVPATGGTLRFTAGTTYTFDTVYAGSGATAQHSVWIEDKNNLTMDLNGATLLMAAGAPVTSSLGAHFRIMGCDNLIIKNGTFDGNRDNRTVTPPPTAAAGGSSNITLFGCNDFVMDNVISNNSVADGFSVSSRTSEVETNSGTLLHCKALNNYRTGAAIIYSDYIFVLGGYYSGSGTSLGTNSGIDIESNTQGKTYGNRVNIVGVVCENNTGSGIAVINPDQGELNTTITGCQMRDNGTFLRLQGDAVVSNCIFQGNIPGTEVLGGGNQELVSHFVYNATSDPDPEDAQHALTITGCVFSGVAAPFVNGTSPLFMRLRSPNRLIVSDNVFENIDYGVLINPQDNNGAALISNNLFRRTSQVINAANGNTTFNDNHIKECTAVRAMRFTGGNNHVRNNTLTDWGSDVANTGEAIFFVSGSGSIIGNHLSGTAADGIHVGNGGAYGAEVYITDNILSGLDFVLTDDSPYGNFISRHNYIDGVLDTSVEGGSDASGSTQNLSVGTVTSVTMNIDISDGGTSAILVPATQSTAGLMSADDKTALDNAGSGTVQNLTIGTVGASTVDVDISGGTSATFPAATASTAGAMTAADKATLDGLVAGSSPFVPFTPVSGSASVNCDFSTARNYLVTATGTSGAAMIISRTNPGSSAATDLGEYQILVVNVPGKESITLDAGFNLDYTPTITKLTNGRTLIRLFWDGLNWTTI